MNQQKQFFFISPFSTLKKRKIAVIAVMLIIFFSLLSYVYYIRLPLIVRTRINLVGIIRVEGYIEEPSVVSYYVNVIREAMLNESIKAVVLVIDSGGGYADYVEEIYLDLLELRERKPLIASIITALSGGYYIAVAADYIYVYPTSMIGNIGVKASMPPILIPSEVFIESGVYKWTGFSLLQFPFTLDRALNNFISAVESNRGDKLKISRTELKKALIYLGSEAVELGLADGIGAVEKAIETAAERANLTSYSIIEIKLNMNEITRLQAGSSNNTSGWLGSLTIEKLNVLHPPPAIHYIYLPPETPIMESQSLSNQFNANEYMSAGGSKVIVDLSHGNMVSWWVLDKLIAELAIRNVTVSFLSSWMDVESQLNNASALLVAAPTSLYSADEVETVKKFLFKGGVLLLFFDPAEEFIGVKGLYAGITSPINSLSINFGFSFAKGYLYNEAEYYGFYRNIYIRNFKNSSITENLGSIVLFTATNIYSMDKGIAWTNSETYSSMTEKSGEYAVIALTKIGNGTVIAIGDLTFLMEPYCYVEDNYKFIANLASFIAKTKIQVLEREVGAAEVARPELPVGTRKIFRDEVDGEVFNLTWIKASEREIVIERANETIHYYLNEEGALERWVSDRGECVYDDPIPEPPFPLTKGKSWRHETNYTLTLDGTEYHGRLIEESVVKSFENITAGDGNTYLCAKVEYRREDAIYTYGMEIKTIMDGYYWISSEAGTVKQEFIIKYYSDDFLIITENERVMLLSIEKNT